MRQCKKHLSVPLLGLGPSSKDKHWVQLYTSWPIGLLHFVGPPFSLTHWCFCVALCASLLCFGATRSFCLRSHGGRRQASGHGEAEGAEHSGGKRPHGVRRRRLLLHNEGSGVRRRPPGGGAEDGEGESATIVSGHSCRYRDIVCT